LISLLLVLLLLLLLMQIIVMIIMMMDLTLVAANADYRIRGGVMWQRWLYDTVGSAQTTRAGYHLPTAHRYR
jgi:uncharacterized membrane protein YsdA (DUF1294 family)